MSTPVHEAKPRDPPEVILVSGDQDKTPNQSCRCDEDVGIRDELALAMEGRIDRGRSIGNLFRISER